MIDLVNFKGMKFPDDYVVRMFFKLGLHNRSGGRVLELGCGNGNNLMLFGEYGWGITGVDIERSYLDMALQNLSSMKIDELICFDLTNGAPDVEGVFDAVILPNINYYIPREAFIAVLKWLSQITKNDGVFFVRARTVDDWRYGRGKKASLNAFFLDEESTGEQGLLNVFYERDELCELVGEHYGILTDEAVMSVYFENFQNGRMIRNNDVVIWGKKAV